MAAPTLRVPPQVQDLIRRSHPELKRKLRLALTELLDDPNAGKQLQRELKGYRSLRVGRYRIIYRAVKLGIDVIANGPRRTIYQDLPADDERK